jgi:ferrous iron transport protein A
MNSANRQGTSMNGNGSAARNGHGSNGHARNGHGSNGQRVPLGHARRGFRGCIHAIEAAESTRGLPGAEIERRLLELGFVEGAMVEILHEGAFGRDPIAVRLNHATIALRRREAMAILVS